MKTTRREFTRLGSAGVLAAAGCSRPRKPNIILFYVDDLRATALDLYHSDAVQTPNLHRLAKSGVVFSHCYTPHPLCLPARVSLWTGQYSSTHGSRYNQKLMSDDAPSMAASFRQAGYSLGVFGKNHCFTPSQRKKWFTADFSMGSPGWKGAISPEAAREIAGHARWLREQGGAFLPPSAAPFRHEIFPTHLATQRAIEFLDRPDGSPFLLWVSLPDPHTPIEVPERFAGALPPARVKLPPFRRDGSRNKNTRMQIYDYLIRGREIPDDYLGRYLSVYSGKIAFVDYELGRLLDALEAKGLQRDTILLFTSDNGEFAGEHHLMAKTGSLVDAMVRMPMAMAWPGTLPGGTREEGLVNQVDIMPTLLNLCGLPTPPAVQGKPLPLTPQSPRRSFVYAEYGNGDPEYTWEMARKLGPAARLGDYSLRTTYELQELEKRERAGHLRMIRTSTHKVIVDSNGDVEFYDLVSDPHELENVHGQAPHQVEEQRLTNLLEQCPQAC